jgi:hypothetical protein
MIISTFELELKQIGSTVQYLLFYKYYVLENQNQDDVVERRFFKIVRSLLDPTRGHQVSMRCECHLKIFLSI